MPTSCCPLPLPPRPLPWRGSAACSRAPRWSAGHRTICPRDLLPEVSEFDKIVNRTTEARAVGGDSDSVKALEVGRYKFGRYGYWEVTLSQNGSVEVTNSNKGTKGTSFGIHFARFGALTFT